MHPFIVIAVAVVSLIDAYGTVTPSSILFTGGTIIGYSYETEELEVIRNGSVLVTNDRVVSVGSSNEIVDVPSDVEKIDITNDIISTGFIDTHKHGWQTVYKTLGSNTSLAEYLVRYGPTAGASHFTPEDVYISQLTGIYEALNAGVTSIVDNAHHTWSPESAEAGLNASIESGARIFWSYALQSIANYTVQDQIGFYRNLAKKVDLRESPTTLGIEYEGFGPDPIVSEVEQVMDLARELNVSVITAHSNQGPWGGRNAPEDLHYLGVLNDSFPIILSHGSYLTAIGANLLRSTNQFISITPESEMHYGHGHPHSYLMQDQAALGVDTHFTFSADILTQARIWLQAVRYKMYDQVVSTWRIPRNNPMSVHQAFLLATRNGGLALRRPDLGVLAPGAKADLVVWKGDSPAMLGWTDPIAAIILHASVGDIEHVLVDGKFQKRNGELVLTDYPDVRRQFLASAHRIQEIWRNTPLPVLEGRWPGGGLYADAATADAQRGDKTGYGLTYI